MSNGNRFNTWRYIVSTFGGVILISIVLLAKFYFTAPTVYANKVEVQEQIHALKVASAENDVRYGFIERTLETISKALEDNAEAQEKRDVERKNQEEKQFEQQQRQLDEIKDDIRKLEK